MGFWSRNLWHWDLGMCVSNLSKESMVQLECLMNVLKVVEPVQEVED